MAPKSEGIKDPPPIHSPCFILTCSPGKGQRQLVPPIQTVGSKGKAARQKVLNRQRALFSSPSIFLHAQQLTPIPIPICSWSVCYLKPRPLHF